MYRIVGNSSERVVLSDLSDVVYYRQVKEITDDEFQNSKDLKREIQRGKISVLEKVQSMRPSAEVMVQTPDKVTVRGLSSEDIKSVFREILPELKVPSVDTKSMVRELAPVISEIVRQELCRIGPLSIPRGDPVRRTSYVDDVYVPTVNVEGLSSNIEAKVTEKSSDDVLDALKALKNMDGFL